MRLLISILLTIYNIVESISSVLKMNMDMFLNSHKMGHVLFSIRLRYISVPTTNFHKISAIFLRIRMKIRMLASRHLKQGGKLKSVNN